MFDVHRFVPQFVVKETREVIVDIETASEETPNLLKFNQEGCAGFLICSN